MRIVRSLLLTPRFTGVICDRARLKTVSTVFPDIEFRLTRSRGGWKTVKTVLIVDGRAITPLKPLKRRVKEISGPSEMEPS